MIIHTRSATPLERVMIEPSQAGHAHVWLRKNITESTVATDGHEMQVWEADEITWLADETPTVAEIQAQFDTLWAAHDSDGLTTTQRLQAQIDELTDMMLGGLA